MTNKNVAFGADEIARLSRLVGSDDFIPVSTPNGQWGMATKSELLSSSPRQVSILDFGAQGNGIADDAPALRDAVAYLKSAGGGTLFVPPGVYFVNSWINISGGACLVAIDFSGITIEGVRGQSIFKCPANLGNRSFFDLGNFTWQTGVNEFIPENIIFRNLSFDFVNGLPFLRVIRLRRPNRGVTVEFCECYQSDIAAGAPANSGDQWFVSLEVSGGDGQDASNPNARNHSTTIRNCTVRNYVQLTAGGGAGCNGLTVVDNELFEPRANGVTLTGIGNVARMDNILISRNKVHRAVGRGIYVQSDAIGDSFNYNIGNILNWQCYARNVEITDNILVDCFEGIRCGQYVQGYYGLIINNNIVRTSPALSVTGTAAVNLRTSGFHWKQDYFGGVDPTFTSAIVDPAANAINFAGHHLCNCCSVTITRTSASDTMPGGILSGISYYVGVVDANSFQLYEGVDPSTGALTNLVDISSTGSGVFTLSVQSVCSNVVIGDDNIFDGGDTVYFVGIRSAYIGGRYKNTKVLMGNLAEVDVGAEFSVRVIMNQGGADRLRFNRATFSVRSDNQTGDALSLAVMNFGDNWNYDVLYRHCWFEADYTSSLQKTSPNGFISDNTTPANRLGPGFGIISTGGRVLNEVPGTFRGVRANFLNCWEFMGNNFPGAGAASLMDDRAKPFEIKFWRPFNLPSIASGTAGTVDVPCQGVRLADASTWSVEIFPLTQNSDFTGLLLTGKITADNVITVTAYNATSTTKDPAITNALIRLTGYR